MTQDHMPPTTIQERVAQMRAAYDKFLRACEQLNEQQALQDGICGEWSAKAVVDHLTGWQVESLPILKQLLKVPEQALDLEIEAFNRTSVKERQDLTWDESLNACKESFDAFDQALSAINLAHYRTHRALISWVKAMTHEYQFHLNHIHQAIEP